MNFVSDNSRPRGPQEQRLLDQGYIWINTNTINPTQLDRKETVTDADGRPDRLGEHSHHGESSHNVISGDLRIQRSRPRFVYEISSEPGAVRQDLVPPNVLYSATSQRGCTFVEGHKCLSPESAERFISRGTLKVVDGRTRRSFPTNNQLRIWLRQVKFNPNGKAHPDSLRNEEPILDARHANPPIPDDVYDDLSRWFENEWHRSKRLRGDRHVRWVLWTFIILMLSVAIAFWWRGISS
ncbi:hypothetical protein F5B21DRAFT_470529 [Xylaria acuta]|nr:hypothetical protein F5B21DRAFT_470529 [Xylaria acuta]